MFIKLWDINYTPRCARGRTIGPACARHSRQRGFLLQPVKRLFYRPETLVYILFPTKKTKKGPLHHARMLENEDAELVGIFGLSVSIERASESNQSLSFD